MKGVSTLITNIRSLMRIRNRRWVHPSTHNNRGGEGGLGGMVGGGTCVVGFRGFYTDVNQRSRGRRQSCCCKLLASEFAAAFLAAGPVARTASLLHSKEGAALFGMIPTHRTRPQVPQAHDSLQSLLMTMVGEGPCISSTTPSSRPVRSTMSAQFARAPTRAQERGSGEDFRSTSISS